MTEPLFDANRIATATLTDHLAHAMAQTMPGYFSYPDDVFLANRLFHAFVGRVDHYLAVNTARSEPKTGPDYHPESPDRE